MSSSGTAERWNSWAPRTLVIDKTGIAVILLAASVHDNAVGIALLDKVAADTDAVRTALTGPGCRCARWRA